MPSNSQAGASVGDGKMTRAIMASPFLFLAVICFLAMDLDSIKAFLEPRAQSGKIEWDTGSIPILDTFHHVDFLDELWRGTTVAFAPSALGFDPVGSWQMFSFLNDLGPLYAIWLFESARCANSFTPASMQVSPFPTLLPSRPLLPPSRSGADLSPPKSPGLFGFAAQLLGIGFIAPIYYFLHYVFSSPLVIRSPSLRSTHVSRIRTILPLILIFSTTPIIFAYLHPLQTTRHYWTWAWQMYPLWISLSQALLGPFLNTTTVSDLSTIRLTLLTLCLLSSATWVSTLGLSPFPISTLFLPTLAAQPNFVHAMRRSLQFDELLTFGASFLWLGYLFSDLRRAGLGSARDGATSWVFFSGAGAAVTACAGPGTAMAVGWMWREEILARVAEERKKK